MMRGSKNNAAMDWVGALLRHAACCDRVPNANQLAKSARFKTGGINV